MTNLIDNNKAYNAERLAQSELMKRDLDRDRLLTQLYQESYDRIQKQIDQFYIKYADVNGLSRAEAMKRVSDMDVTKFNKAAAEAVRTKDFSSYTNQWLKTYNLKMKVSRLELLQSQLLVEVQNLTAKTYETLEKARYDELTTEYKRQAGILGLSTGNVPKRLESILDADFYGVKFSDRIWGSDGLNATLQKEIFGSLNRIFTDMMGFKQERNRLAKKFNTSKENAQRLIKTEISRINTQTDLQMLKANDFTHLIYVAEVGACKICAPLDNKAIPIDEATMGENIAPMHPNCRCSFYGQILMKRKDGTTNLDDFDVLESDKSYRSVMSDWLSDVDINKAKVSDLTSWSGHTVDGHNVVLDYSETEKEIAQWLSQKLGVEVQMVPRVNNPKNIASPDYLVNKMRFDLKQLTGNGKYVVDNNVRKAKTQSENIIFDLTNLSLPTDKFYEQLSDVYKYGRRGLNISIIKNGDDLLDIIAPNK